MTDTASIQVSYKSQTSVQRKFIIFSYILFLFIFLLGSVIFINLMNEIHYKNSKYELMQIIEISRLKLEVSASSKIDEGLYLFNDAGEITKARDVNLVEHKANITEVLGQTGDEILARIKGLKIREIEYFETKDKKQIVAIGEIPALNWYITATRPVAVEDSMRTDMAVLFYVMMAVIFFVFVFFNIFIASIMKPLNRMVKTINQTFADWDLKPQEGEHYNEIETFGEFFHLTIMDQLTGIYNRRYLDGSLKRIIKSHTHTGNSLSVLMIDIDYFKKYNDAYGHDKGDDCLKKIVFALSKCIMRKEDFVARYGGEEFVVVLPNTDESGAQAIAEKLLKKVSEYDIPHKVSDIANYVTISIGGTTGIVKHTQNPLDYIKAADKALYESKKNGRNRYTYENFPVN
ncbi:MAG: GGDEF domain-containing protein [Fibromonadales bacterium]|nr:GGDEF domain-containing protein [Fibromonadales bacterium]